MRGLLPHRVEGPEEERAIMNPVTVRPRLRANRVPKADSRPAAPFQICRLMTPMGWAMFFSGWFAWTIVSDKARQSGDAVSTRVRRLTLSPSLSLRLSLSHRLPLSPSLPLSPYPLGLVRFFLCFALCRSARQGIWQGDQADHPLNHAHALVPLARRRHPRPPQRPLRPQVASRHQPARHCRPPARDVLRHRL